MVEEGGFAFPHGSDIGAPEEVVIGKLSGILDGAGFRPGFYSWWNAIPYGLARQATAEDKRRGRDHLSRVVDLHADLRVVLAVGAVAQAIVRVAEPGVKVMTTRSPIRASAVQREEIRRTL